MKAQFTNDQTKNKKVTFSSMMEAFRGNVEDGNALESEGALKFTPASKDTGWKSTLSVEPGLTMPDPEALAFIKNGLDIELGPGKSEEVFRRAGLDGATQVTGQQLLALEEGYKQVRAQILTPLQSPNRPTVDSWKKAVTSGVSDGNPATEMPLKDLLQHKDATFTISKSGSGGAIIVTIPGNKGAVIKLEELESVEKAGKLSSVMKDTLPTGPKGFNVSDVETVTDLSSNKETVDLLVSKLKGMQNQDGMTDVQLSHIAKHLKKLEDPEISKSIGISKMEFVPGVQVNMLPLDDKVALLQSGVLAEQVGKAAIYGQLAGLCDHVAITDGGTNNLSNFMIDPKTGKLAPIDLDTKDVNLGTDKPPFYGVKGSGPALKDLAEFVKQAGESPEAMSEAISKMVLEQKSGVGQKTPLQEPLCLMTVPEGREGLVKGDTSEARLLKETLSSPEIKERQAISMLKGISSALKEVGGDKEKLKASFEKHKSGMDPQEFEDFTNAIDGIDFDKLDRQIDQYEKGFQQKLNQAAWDKRQSEGMQQKAPAQKDLDKLAKLQTRLEKLSQDKPPLGERFKAFFTKGGIEAMKAQVTKDIEKTKLDITAKIDGAQFDARMDMHRGKVDNLKQERDQALPGAREYASAKRQAEGGSTLLAMDELQGQTILKSDAREQLKSNVEEQVRSMETHKQDYESVGRLTKEIDSTKDLVSHGEKVAQKKTVREELGKSVGKGTGEPVKHGQHL